LKKKIEKQLKKKIGKKWETKNCGPKIEFF